MVHPRLLAAAAPASDIASMGTLSPDLLEELARFGVAAVYAPVIDLANAGRIELPALLPLLARSSSPLSHASRMTLRTYLPPARPSRPSLLLDGGVLGAEVPLSKGAWCVVEADSIAIHVPAGLPDTIATAAVGRPLGEVVDIHGLAPMPYLIASVDADGWGERRAFDIVRAPVPLVRL